jgi:hypothetical protein
MAWKQRASGKLIATAILDGPCARRACAPAGRDEGTAARHEQRNNLQQARKIIDDILSEITRRGLREDKTTMEDRSSRRVRILVTLIARSRLVR